MAPPPSKKAKTSTIQVIGGSVRFLQEQTVSWTIPDFETLFLKTNGGFGLLNRQQMEFSLDCLEGYPLTKWKVSMCVGHPLDDVPWDWSWEIYKNSIINTSRPQGNRNWLISLKYDVLTPAKDLDGLFVSFGTSLNRADRISTKYPETEIEDLGALRPSNWMRTILPLCSVADLRNLLQVDGSGGLVLTMKFTIFTTKGKSICTPTQLEEEIVMKGLKTTALEQFKQFWSEPENVKGGGDKVTLVSNDGLELQLPQYFVKARSSVFSAMLTPGWQEEAEGRINLNFPSEVVSWMIRFLETGDVQEFAVKNGDQLQLQGSSAGIKSPFLSDLVLFADMYGFQDLKEFFGLKIVSMAFEKSDLAPELLELAKKFSLVAAAEKLEIFLGLPRSSNN